jgi:hypothetical protein
MTLATNHGSRLKLCKDWIDKLRFAGKEKTTVVASLITALEAK